MSEKLKFFKGIEADLPSSLIPGAIYHCTDTGNTYLATSATTKTLFSTNEIDTDTTYTLSGKIDTGAYKLTLTDSGNKTSTASVPAMGGATSSAPSTPGLVPIATSANRTKYLRGDGTWAIPTDTYLRVYRQTSGYDADYPILVSRTKTADIATVGTDASYESVYAVIAQDGTYTPTINPHSGAIKAYSFTSGAGTSDFSAGKIKFDIINIPTTSGGSTFGVGTSGQVLKSNGSSVYWGTDNNTTYSAATSSTLGLVKIGYTQSGKNYPVQLSNGQMYVNVPWTDNNTTYGVVSTTADGLAPKRDGSTTKFLRGDGTWAVPPNTNTHYTTGITAGASGTTSNSAASNPYVKIKDDSTHRSQIQIKGGGATTVSSDANGVITISSTDNNTTYSAATSSAAGLMSAADKTKLDGIAAQANKYSLPTASSSTLGGVKIGSNINISNGVISVPAANKDTAGVTVVYPAASCTSFSSDSGAITPLAAQKSAELFAITRPPKRSSSNPANPGAAGTCTINNIVRWLNTAGDVQDSKITIEDVKNTRDTTKTAQVISIPAEGGKKMVYGYCTDQVDGTSFIGGVFDASATSYPYASGLAIGGTSGNLLWKGKQVATTDMIPASLKNPNALTIQGGGITSFTYDGSTAKTLNIKASSNVSISSKTNGEITISAEDTTYSASNGIIVENNIIKHANSSITAGTASTAAATLTNGGSFNIPSITYDAYGHITGTGSTKITLPTITAPEEVVISSTQPSSDLWIDTTDSTKAKIKYKNGSSYKEIQAASGVYVGSGTMPTGYNVQIDPTSTADSTVLVTKAEFDALVARVAALETA